MSRESILPITGIGSLPHHNVDSALEFSFRFDIPFFPQIPVRNPNEYMLSQALHGFPGVTADADGMIHLNLEVWRKNRTEFAKKLEDALRDKNAAKVFELKSEFASCWKPFLWEIIERKTPAVKVQIAGPLTCQWALRLSDGQAISTQPELATQILKFVTIRASTMVEAVRKTGARILFFLDEPALFALDPKNPRHTLALGELNLLIGALKKQGATIGLHCCSNTDWRAILALDLDILSLDAALSLNGLLKNQEELKQFAEAGRRLSLGAIATNGDDASNVLFSQIPARLLKQALLSPACGLALKTPQECEKIYTELRNLQTKLLDLPVHAASLA